MIRWHWILQGWGAHFIIVIIVQLSPTSKVCRSFVFMSSSILFQVSIEIRFQMNSR